MTKSTEYTKQSYTVRTTPSANLLMSEAQRSANRLIVLVAVFFIQTLLVGLAATDQSALLFFLGLTLIFLVILFFCSALSSFSIRNYTQV
jgi:hypothetical protein